jgi:hypothetical protein
LVLVDTLSASGLLYEENHNGDAGAAINGLKLMAHELECLVLFVHHPSKHGTDARGAYTLHANVDVGLTIDYEGGKPLRFVRLTKSKESPAPRMLGCFTLAQESVGVDEFGDPITTCRVVIGEYEPGMEKKSTLVSTLTTEQVAKCQAGIAAGDYRSAVQCQSQWAGHVIGKVLGLGTVEAADRSLVQTILDRLVVEGWLRISPEYDPASRKTHKYVRVGDPCDIPADGGDEGRVRGCAGCAQIQLAQLARSARVYIPYP